MMGVLSVVQTSHTSTHVKLISVLQERLLRNGTTTAAYFGTIHLEGSKILADVVHDKGQRALIGKVNMMRNCPEYYREMSVQDSIRDTEEFIRYVRGIQVSRGKWM